jgi:DNA repair protein RadC
MKKVKEFKIVPSGSTECESVQITSSEASYKFISQFFYEDVAVYESFFLVLLNRQNVTIGWAKISQGGVSGTVVDSRIVAKYAVDSLASSVILCHNHPGGTLGPSKQDKDLTEKIKWGLELFDCKVLDHMIIIPPTEKGPKFYSFADEGLL